jgi:hypothetical protein
MAIDGKMLAVVALALIVVYFFFIKSKKSVISTFVMEGAPYDSTPVTNQVPQNLAPVQNDMSMSATAMMQNNMMPSTPSAALLPKEIPIDQDFSQFSTDAILSSQNYLDPRNLIGYPETVGGTLRNANWQMRSEPPNPRDPVSIFNLSTIVPEQMRPAFEIESNEWK